MFRQITPYGDLPRHSEHELTETGITGTARLTDATG